MVGKSDPCGFRVMPTVRADFPQRGAQKMLGYSLYSPPEHSDGTVHRTKADAVAAEAEH
jgi:hypothetical protein